MDVICARRNTDVYTEVTEVDDLQILEEIYALRARVWRTTGGLAANAFPTGQWRDAYDALSRHWVVRDEHGRLAAAARLTVHASLDAVPEAAEYLRYDLPRSGPIAAPARVVVCPSAQGVGLAGRLLDVQDQATREAGAQRAVRQASPAMVRLLVRRGWQIVGPATPDPRFPGVPFQVAQLDLVASERTPA
jgi:N-acyl-L-homoserine lactone synthetase